LRCLPGGSGIHVVLSDAEEVRFRAEVRADAGEVVSLQVDLDEQGLPRLRSRGREILLLPAGPQFEPALPISRAADGTSLDLIIIVDGTLRTWRERSAADAEKKEPLRNTLLLARKDVWATHVEALIDFAGRLAESHQVRFSVLAFGDHPPPAELAADLRPEYDVHPLENERAFQSFDADRLRGKLMAIPPTSGADYVDALADALATAANAYWDYNARKIVLVTGDSPGFSITHPLPRSADLCVRRRDVDTQAERLHKRGVEVITIFHAPPADLGLHGIAYQRELLGATEAQYRRLASLPETAFEAVTFDPARATESIGRIGDAIARGATFGELVRAGGKG
jgi:hypothetical protein